MGDNSDPQRRMSTGESHQKQFHREIVEDHVYRAKVAPWQRRVASVFGIRFERERPNTEVTLLRTQYETDPENQKQQIERLKRKHHSLTEELRKSHRSEIRLIDTRYSKQLRTLQENNERLADEKEQELSQLRGNHQNSIEKQKQQAERALITLKESHKVAIQQRESELQQKESELHALNRVLLTRDNEQYIPPVLSEVGLKQDPDEYIKVKFSDIIRSVDGISRSIWKVNQTKWTAEALNSAITDHTQRALKKAILQDTIWTVLQRHILCSPFRMFGEEGRDLEKQWNEQCGQDPTFDNGIYAWPPLDIETERWRYITLRECRKALIQPVPSRHDPRAKLKEGFMTSKARVVKELLAKLDEVVEWGDTDRSQIEPLVGQVLDVWLEFGMYRCRLIAFFKAAIPQRQGEDNDRLAMSKNWCDGLELNTVPGLMRHGNAKGVDLRGRPTIVGDFKGEAIRLGR